MLVGAKKHFYHRCRLCHLSGEDKERQHRGGVGTRSFEQTAALLMVKIRQPSHEFTFGVGISFIPYPLVLTPVV
jgi:hypothetical protein